MELEKLTREHKLESKIVNDYYFMWADRVERHIRIVEDKEPMTQQEKEIMNGFSEAHDIPPLSENEIRILARMFKTLRNAN